MVGYFDESTIPGILRCFKMFILLNSQKDNDTICLKALAHYNCNYKKVVVSYTHNNFFPTTATIFSTVMGSDFHNNFFGKIEKIFVVCEGLKTMLVSRCSRNDSKIQASFCLGYN